MSERITGSCHCGGVRFEIIGEPRFLARCHCSRCRKVCSGAFHTTLGVPAEQFVWKSDREGVESYKPEPPFQIVRDFCRVCGCYVGELQSDLDPLVACASILDGDPGRTPIGHEWVSSAVPWYAFRDGLLCFAEDYPPIEVWMDADALAARKTEPPAFVSERKSERPTPGSCLCGRVRYEVGALSSVVTCHCVDCRKSQGGEFSTNGAAADFRLLQGESELRAYESSPGNERCFCSHCGSTLFARQQGSPERIRLASLDADPGVNPEAHVWTSQRVPWQHIPEDAVTFEKGAD